MSLPPVLPATARSDTPPVLLPYQQRWIEDASPFKVMEKGRRTGVTWAEAADDVLIAAADKAAGGQNVYYIGTDKEMTEEYIDAVALWARAFNYAAGALEEGLWDEDEDDKHIKTYTVRFPASGHRIVALAARPRKLRGRQGVLVGDEAAFMDDLPGLLKSAMAFLIWGGKVRIISTHDGDDNPFNDLLGEIRARKRKGSIHRVTFRDAVEQGLYRRVCLRLGKDWSAADEQRWVDEVYAFYGDDADEELDCIPSAGSGVYLATGLIERRMIDAPVLRLAYRNEFAERDDHSRWRECQDWIDDQLQPLIGALNADLQHVFGEDFGRSGDLTVLAPAAIEPGLIRRAPFLVELRNVPFRQQEQIVFHLLDRLPKFTAGAFDARGNGQQLAEVVWQRYGTQRIERVMLSEPWYREHMPGFKSAFEDGLIAIPRDADVRQDLRDFKTVKGVTKLPEGSRRTGTDGKPRHGDAGVALALMWYASQRDVAPIEFTPAPRSGPFRGRFEDDDDDHPGAGRLIGAGAW